MNIYDLILGLGKAIIAAVSTLGIVLVLSIVLFLIILFA